MHGIIGEPGGVVTVGVAAGDPVDALAKEFARLVVDLPSLPSITKAARERIGQTESIVGRLEQDRAAVRAAVLLVKGCDEGLIEEVSKQDRLLRGRVGQAKASGVLKVALASTFYHMEAFVFSHFVNFPG